MHKGIHLSASESTRLVASYVRIKILDQVKAVAPILLFLLLFHVVVLGGGITDGSVIAIGILLVVLGLALFIEGLSVGLMPLGESIGLRLPASKGIPALLFFALLLGFGATYAEPAIASLSLFGASVRPWNAPLLFSLLNNRVHLLVLAIALGVGFAVVLSLLRLVLGWSLKVPIVIIVSILIAFTIYAHRIPNLRLIAGLAWDAGGATTGPVTVPIILALGIGASRAFGKAESPVSGFGIVTLASLLPVLAVLLLGTFLLPHVPEPMSERDFADPQRRGEITALFASRADLEEYVLQNLSPAYRQAFFDAETDGEEAADPEEAVRPPARVEPAATGNAADARTRPTLLRPHLLSAARAVFPLGLLLLLILLLIRERPAHTDEVVFGIVLAFVGMAFLTSGIENGLAFLGGKVGRYLPSSFTTIELPEEEETIPAFDPAVVQNALGPDGSRAPYFMMREPGGFRPVPFDEERFDPDRGTYTHIPKRGPLFGAAPRWVGYGVVLLFALLMGFTATFAEPALITLGRTVEEISVGVFKQTDLIRAVAVGIGFGLAFGISKILWNLPLVWLLVPPYALLIVLTLLSDSDYVHIAWDSAGVTTGPVTVPLVIAMGLGVSGEVGTIEGFGLLGLSSVYPIITVLLIGFIVNIKHRRYMRG